MMEFLAYDILDSVCRSVSPDTQSLNPGEDVIIDVGVTKEARFVDKARVLEKEYVWHAEGERRPVEQVHLTGFDTLVRLLDVKYYPPEHSLRPLEGLFERHGVRVTRRLDDAWCVFLRFVLCDAARERGCQAE